MDIGKEEVMNIAKRFGLKIDDQKQRLGPQLIFLHNLVDQLVNFINTLAFFQLTHKKILL